MEFTPHPRHRPRLRVRRLGSVLCLVATIGGTAAFVGRGGPAGPGDAVAQVRVDGGRTIPITVEAAPAVQRSVLDLAITFAKLRAEIADLDRQLVGAQARLVELQVALDDVVQRLTATQTDLKVALDRLTGRATIAYQRRSDHLGLVLSVRRLNDLRSGEMYANAVAVVDNRLVVKLRRVEADQVAERAKLDSERTDLETKVAVLGPQRGALGAQAAELEARLHAVGGVPVMGASQLTAAQLAAWFHSNDLTEHLAGGMKIEELASIYVEEGTLEGVRGDLAFAQAIIETGSFGHAADNNYAGIGACDTCASELLFPTPRDGVRGQIQMLRNFADPTSTAARLANPPSPTIYGRDPADAAQKYDTYAFKGVAPLWNLMGGGNWATDPGYAVKVLKVYAAMLDFAAGRSGRF